MRYIKLSRDFYIKARQRFSAELKPASLAIFCSNDVYPTSADGHMAFEQASDILYLSIFGYVHPSFHKSLLSQVQSSLSIVNLEKYESEYCIRVCLVSIEEHFFKYFIWHLRRGVALFITIRGFISSNSIT